MMKLEGLESVEHHTVRVNSIKLHYVEAGEGAPMDGFPETWFHGASKFPYSLNTTTLLFPTCAAMAKAKSPLFIVVFLMNDAIQHHHGENCCQVNVRVPEKRACPLLRLLMPEANCQVE